MSKIIKIRNKSVGKGQPVFIIAEAASNHNQNLTQAKELIDIAFECGVDAVKFQLFKADELYKKSNPMFKIMKNNEFPREWLRALYKYAEKKGFIFLASPFDLTAIDLLVKIGSPALKLASSETTNLRLLRYAASKKKPLLISTGMCNIADIYEAVEVAKSVGNQDVALLHCTSLYPAKPSHVNLLAMDTLYAAFDLPVGYSDHTLGIGVPIAAAARGACIVEKHFTLSKKLKGPDHFYALEPKQLKEMVIAIREVEQSIGSAIKKMLPGEEKLARRSSLIAKNNIPKGAKLTKDMIIIDRPALGIKPRFLEAVIGQKTKRDIKKGTPVTWEIVG